MHEHYRYNPIASFDPWHTQPPVGSDNKSEEDPFDEERHKEGCISAVITFVLLLLAAGMCYGLAGCKSVEYIPVVTVKDSVRTEVRTETVTIHDTVSVQLPPQIVERTTPDSTSHLETDFAVSDAAIRGGLLFHSLRTKATPIPVEVDHTVTTKDSTSVHEKEVPVPYPVEVKVAKPLTFWQNLRIWLGTLTLIAIVCVAGYGAFRVWKKVK